MIQYFSFSNVKPALSFAMSFGAIAIFTFIYLNDLNIFNQSRANNNVENSKSILKHQSLGNNHIKLLSLFLENYKT